MLNLLQMATLEFRSNSLFAATTIALLLTLTLTFASVFLIIRSHLPHDDFGHLVETLNGRRYGAIAARLDDNICQRTKFDNTNGLPAHVYEPCDRDSHEEFRPDPTPMDMIGRIEAIHRSFTGAN